MNRFHDDIHAAWQRGQQINLSGATYGRQHWGGFNTATTPEPYYYFLSGLCAHYKCQRVLEIGTHTGGSAVAMVRGMQAGACSAPRLVTIDLNTESDSYLPQQPEAPFITKIVGDANNTKTALDVMAAFSERTIDMMYIDGDHMFAPTFNALTTYAMLFSPRVIVIDDITLNSSMELMWRFLKKAPALTNIVDAAELIPDIRPLVDGHRAGFGVIELVPHH
jgi:predicted O-methyltransferase YrrM